MSKYIPGNHKHFTAVGRLYIERQLNADSSFKDIARYLCKDPNTISKEIRSHRLSDSYPVRGLFLNAKNFCIHHFHCQKKNVCGKIILCDITSRILSNAPSTARFCFPLMVLYISLLASPAEFLKRLVAVMIYLCTQSLHINFSYAPCCENKTRSQELNLDNKCFQQS